jgi:hypothetical protein
MNVLFIAAVMVSVAIAVFRTRYWLSAAQETPKEAAFWVGLAGLSAVLVVFIPVNVFAHLTGDHESWIFGSERFDGGIVETLTIVFYFCAIFQCIALFRRAETLFGAASAPLWRGVLLVGAVAFGVMIGEEISWGQHWFGWATPEKLAAANLQGETNVHNLMSPRLYDTIYQVLGWLLIGAPAIASLAPIKWPNWSVIAFLRGCFDWPFTFPLMMAAGLLLQHEVFEELSEMVLALAILQALLSFAKFHKSAE